MLHISFLLALFSAAVVIAYTTPYDEAPTNYDNVQLFGRDGRYQSNSGRSKGDGNSSDWAGDNENSQNSEGSGYDAENDGGSGKSSGGENKDDNEGSNNIGSSNGNCDEIEAGNSGGNSAVNDGKNSGISENEVDTLAGEGLNDRTIDLSTNDLGTSYSRSSSSKVVRSRKNNYFRKNFVNKVTANLRLVRKIVHVSKHITYERPLTVDNIKVHQQTDYVKNIYPVLKKLSIKEYGTAVQPARLVTIQREANSNRRVIRHNEQVSSKSRRINLGRKIDKTRNLGVRNLDESGNGNDGNGNGGGSGSGRYGYL